MSLPQFSLLDVAFLLFVLHLPYIPLLTYIPLFLRTPLHIPHLPTLTQKMIQALNMPYSSKRDEIMSRYRPIAPKPQNNTNTNTSTSCEAQLVPEKFRQSPYLRNIWSHLQARPTRTRKRGRTAGISPASHAIAASSWKQQQHDRQQQQYQGFVGLGSGVNFSTSHAGNLSYHACGNYRNNNNGGDVDGDGKNSNNNNIVELPLLPCGNLLTKESKLKAKAIDLNSFCEENNVSDFNENDLTLQLQIPINNNKSKVISPRPVRPVGSSISILGPIGKNLEPSSRFFRKVSDKVDEEIEVELLPAVITDRGNKVRVVNSAYKELVGQPECPWLDSMVNSRSGRRISGEVMLNFPGLGSGETENGFTSWARIEWECDGKKNNVNAFCDVVKLDCESNNNKDFVFYWRFHTREPSPSYFDGKICRTV